MIKKRIKALVLVVVLAMAICSCGKNNDEEEPTGENFNVRDYIQ